LFDFVIDESTFKLQQLAKIYEHENTDEQKLDIVFYRVKYQTTSESKLIFMR